MDKTEEPFSIRPWLDTRRKKDNGRYPLKLAVYSVDEKTKKLFRLPFDLSESEFEEIKENPKRKHYKKLKEDIDKELKKAEEAAVSLERFSLMAFSQKYQERLMMTSAPVNGDLLSGYERIIQGYMESGQIKTAKTYQSSRSSILEYLERDKKKRPKKILFAEVTKKWLQDYETFMRDKEQKSTNTISQYLRSMRAVFNAAIDAKEIGSDIYPFGKKAFVIPKGENTKQALTLEQLQGILKAVPMTEEQRAAKDFWMLSYSLYGLNMADILNLRYKQVKGNVLNIRFREKTKRTSKTSLPSWRLFLRQNECIDIIEKYGHPNRRPEQLIFSSHRGSDIASRFFLRPDMTEKEKVSRRDSFNDFIVENLKALAEANGIDTTNMHNMAARHTSATMASRAGFTKMQIQRNQGRTSKDITEGYIDFDTDKELQAMADCLFKL
jgi:integrase/recombinase XerD